MAQNFIYGKKSVDKKTSSKEGIGKVEEIVTDSIESSKPKKKEPYKGELFFEQFIRYEVLVDEISVVYPLKAKEFSLTNPSKRDFIKAIYLSRNIDPKNYLDNI